MKLAFNYDELNFEFEKKDMNIYVMRKVELLLRSLILLCLLIVSINFLLNNEYLIFSVIWLVLFMINIISLVRHLRLRRTAMFVIKKDMLYLYVETLFIRRFKVESVREEDDFIQITGFNQKFFYIPIHADAHELQTFLEQIKHSI